jgi:lactaldehyde dehydrogenase/glycolaldehyde dehydrogenase
VEFGDPREDPDTGPQVSEQELTSTVQAVEHVQQEGGQVLLGGEQPEGGEYESGYWYKPTVVSGVDQEMDIVRDEVFGPVMPIVEIESLEEAIEYANDSRYGLTSYVHTNDYQTTMRVAEELEFGETYINRTAGESWHGHHIG